MDDGVITTSDLLRLAGVMCVGVGIAWVVQILGFPSGGSPLDRLMWILGAAAIAGAGVGTWYAGTALRRDEGDMTIFGVEA